MTITAKHGLSNRETLCRLLDHHLRSKEPEWTAAKLAKESGQTKGTVSRIMNYQGNPAYRPSMRVIAAFALALELTEDEWRELFFAAFPEFSVWKEAANQKYSVTETDILLNDKGLPLLVQTKKDAN